MTQVNRNIEPNVELVRPLTDMGFSKDQATAALRAAEGNPDVAVEYLVTGIPEISAEGQVEL